MNLGRTLRTLRHLKAVQWRAQLRHAIGGRSAPSPLDPSDAGWALDRLAAPPPPPPDHARWDGGGRIELVGRAVDFGSLDAIDWSFAEQGPLWAYQLHFFEWARSREVPAELRSAPGTGMPSPGSRW